MTAKQWMVIGGAVLLTIALRVIGTPIANFGSMIALTLLIGATMRSPIWGLLPLGVRLLTDVVIEVHTGYGFFAGWPFDYTAYILIYAIGTLVPTTNYARMVTGSLTSVVLYFAISNFGAWWSMDMYPQTAGGLWTCYLNGIPFARGTVWGNLLFAPVFFALWNQATVTGTDLATLSAAEAK